MSHKHITSFQRNELSTLLRAGLKQKDIARLLGKTPSAICQELKRNETNTLTGYSAKIAKEDKIALLGPLLVFTFIIN